MRKILILVFVVISVGLSALEITLKPSVKVSENTVYLEDIVLNAKGNIDQYEHIKRTEILKIDTTQKYKNILAKEIILKLQVLYPEISVQVKGQLVSVYKLEKVIKKESLSDNVKDFIQNFFSLSDKSEIEIINFPQVYVPVETYEVQYYLPQTQPQSGRVLVQTKILSNNELVKEFGISVRIKEKYLVYRLNKGVKKGDPIKNEDFELIEKVDLYGMDYLNPKDNHDELIARYNLPKGRFLKSGDFSTVPDVCRLDMVNVIIKGELFNMQYVALAKDNGWKGDRIVLENLESRKIFQAEVIDKNTVMINLEGK